MRYPPDQKAKAKDAILEAGARELRINGFNGIGVDGLAAAAGVTSGAFYSNFANKEALLEAVIDSCLGEPFVSANAGNADEWRKRLREWLTDYISLQHRNNAGPGCVMPALSADVARASSPVRSAYQHKMLALVRKIAACLAGPQSDRERRAWGIVSVMVGAVAIARAMSGEKEAARALESSLQTALSLIGR
ncbi:TetR/AcrR family transcriptional regulator [uncultured Methylovirgula sp.]|uniref:TetR/AcrR family transcriptional regulator n=1 Tax=uncultured Methylovirgula sp. TaxID=1285960 RepID=UPI00263825D0|nr:TetR/AcrR family transcriptional regulator [uncultured Methylovirgula sp.]